MSSPANPELPTLIPTYISTSMGSLEFVNQQAANVTSASDQPAIRHYQTLIQDESQKILDRLGYYIVWPTPYADKSIRLPDPSYRGYGNYIAAILYSASAESSQVAIVLGNISRVNPEFGIHVASIKPSTVKALDLLTESLVTLPKLIRDPKLRITLPSISFYERIIVGFPIPASTKFKVEKNTSEEDLERVIGAHGVGLVLPEREICQRSPDVVRKVVARIIFNFSLYMDNIVLPPDFFLVLVHL